MPAGLTFNTKDGDLASHVHDIKTIVYEDSTGNQYTFGVNDSNVFSTFKYKPQNGSEVNYSATAKNFVENGAVAALLDIRTEVGAIKTKTDKLDPVSTDTGTLGKVLSGIKAETDKITGVDTKVGAIKTNIDKLDPVSTDTGTLGKVLSGIKAETDKITGVDTKVGAIKTKTDNMPDNLKTELASLTQIGEAIRQANVSDAAKTALQNSFNKAIEDTINDPSFSRNVQPKLKENFEAAYRKAAGSDAQEWFETNVRNTMSKPVFEIPADDNAPLSWDW